MVFAKAGDCVGLAEACLRRAALIEVCTLAALLAVFDGLARNRHVF
jgi:hypothetical protein